MRRSQLPPRFKPIQGFSLLEIMIVLAIFSILLLAVSTDVKTILAKHRILSELNQMSSLIHLSRAHAIDTQSTATLSPTRDLASCQFSNWNMQKMVFFDFNNNKLRDNTEPLLAALPKVGKGVKAYGPRKAIQFLASGVVGSTATLAFCPTQQNAVLNRALIVSLQGRIRVSKDYNQDYIHEVRQGVPVNCP